MAGDRVSEAYEGKMSEAMQEVTRKRIDWFRTQAEGENILDIGCSQGILPILLGRDGRKVIGIDNDSESIEYANNALKSEEQSTQDNVTFICDDFLGYDLGNDMFDTIILGEILEHLYDPVALLEKAAMVLKEEGKLVASVPFGINRHPDHKRTYYLFNFYDHINTHFCAESVVFMGKWIAIIATSKNNPNKKELLMDHMFMMRYETAVFHLNEILETEKNDLKTKRETEKNQLTDKLEQSYDYTKKLKNELEEVKNNNKRLENYLTAEKQSNKKLEDDLAAEKQNSKKLEDTLSAEKKNNKRLEAEKKDYAEKLKTCKSELKNYKIRYFNMRKSVFGKAYLKCWTMTNKLRNIARKIPPLRMIVRKYRSKKAERQSLLQQSVTLSDEKKVTLSNEKNVESSVTSEKEIPTLNAAERRLRFESNTDQNFFEGIKDILNKIPESNGGRFYEKHPYRIGIIADKFLYAAFKDAADFVFLTPDAWEDAVENTDFLLVVSAWRGLNEEWMGAAREGSEKRNVIYQMIDRYKERNKITVFYSKEDPPHYSDYIGIAKRCDFIFTTCAEVVDDYKRDCNNENVEVLCFGINPLYHNPVGFQNPYKREGVIFSGSWMIKYPERLKDMDMLFEGVLESSRTLKIIDRNYYVTSENYRYPERYWPYVSPAIDHDMLQKVHKLYDWALNINTVTSSMTMFANRGYELQATGNLLISNYSVGVNSKLPMIFTVTDKFEIGQILNAFSGEELYQRQIAGIRSVMTGETAFDRVGQIIETIGLEKNRNERKILVVANVVNDGVKEMFEKQSYPSKTLIAADEFTQEALDQSDMVAFFGAGMDYDMFYLEDMANGFKYTGSRYITKDAYYDGTALIKGKEHDYVSVMKNKYATVFWSSDFDAEQLKAFEGEVALEGGYSVDHFNFNLKKFVLPKREKYDLSVIVPVYNNGKQLLGKSFSSLQRSTIFDNMEILLVDDGSTDGYTDKVVHYLEKNYANVKAFLFGDGGSGSASRPRNKGAELASAEYIAYLDSDDEAVFDGYARLYAMSREGDYDITVGNMLKLTTEIEDAKYYKKINEKYGSDLIVNDTRSYMEKTNFTPMRIQAMVIRKKIVLDNHIIQPVGAAGEDTLFCWELFFNASTIKVIELPVHLYYAMVEGSTVNSIGKSFFEKYYLIEGPKRAALEKYGVLELYMQTRYEYYFTRWTLKKLSQVAKENIEECAKIVYDTHKIYEDVYHGTSEIIHNFISKVENNDFAGAAADVVSYFAQ